MCARLQLLHKTPQLLSVTTVSNYPWLQYHGLVPGTGPVDLLFGLGCPAGGGQRGGAGRAGGNAQGPIARGCRAALHGLALGGPLVRTTGPGLAPPPALRPRHPGKAARFLELYDQLRGAARRAAWQLATASRKATAPPAPRSGSAQLADKPATLLNWGVEAPGQPLPRPSPAAASALNRVRHVLAPSASSTDRASRIVAPAGRGWQETDTTEPTANVNKITRAAGGGNNRC